MPTKIEQIKKIHEHIDELYSEENVDPGEAILMISTAKAQVGELQNQQGDPFQLGIAVAGSSESIAKAVERAIKGSPMELLPIFAAAVVGAIGDNLSVKQREKLRKAIRKTIFSNSPFNDEDILQKMAESSGGFAIKMDRPPFGDKGQWVSKLKEALTKVAEEMRQRAANDQQQGTENQHGSEFHQDEAFPL